METIKLNQTFQEFYGVTNDICPICGKRFVGISPIFKLGTIAYHLSCYNDVMTPSKKSE